MPGCNECKFYERDFDPGMLLPNMRCLAGHQDEMLAWWKENGFKRENPDNMPCHEHHDKSLMEMNRLLDKMNELL